MPSPSARRAPRHRSRASRSTTARWSTAAWNALAWAVFGLAYVGAIVFVSSGSPGLRWSPGNVLLGLDEPTAALDAETGHALFERYAVASRRAGHAEDGRVTILVSHRFSTVRMADCIVVLDGARAVEVGTHEELLAQGGQYAELYAIQAAAYR